jgi:hypothetical protein
VVVVLAWRMTPTTLNVGLKKSKILLLSMTLPELLFGLADPNDATPLIGRLAPAGPILLFEIVLLLLAPPVEVLMRMVPPGITVPVVDEPSTEQFVMVLFCAPLMSRMVLVPAVFETVVFEMVSEFPPEFKPSMVTLSAPLRSINGLPATIAPETVLTPVGVIRTKV